MRGGESFEPREHGSLTTGGTGSTGAQSTGAQGTGAQGTGAQGTGAATGDTKSKLCV
jgi:hypothetical protein